ncbi:hypothetical protein UPYG_G00026850 [Umbra pygmaea]|uniref:Uncharacterized protein n=1 Tax=Umbra pygmaea TaxID=75934 RepID=A0ABD0XPG0_UMBPY
MSRRKMNWTKGHIKFFGGWGSNIQNGCQILLLLVPCLCLLPFLTKLCSLMFWEAGYILWLNFSFIFLFLLSVDGTERAVTCFLYKCTS